MFNSDYIISHHEGSSQLSSSSYRFGRERVRPFSPFRGKDQLTINHLRAARAFHIVHTAQCPIPDWGGHSQTFWDKSQKPQGYPSFTKRARRTGHLLDAYVTRLSREAAVAQAAEQARKAPPVVAATPAVQAPLASVRPAPVPPVAAPTSSFLRPTVSTLGANGVNGHGKVLAAAATVGSPIAKRGPGRPAGSKNKPKTSLLAEVQPEAPVVKRRPARKAPEAATSPKFGSESVHYGRITQAHVATTIRKSSLTRVSERSVDNNRPF